MPAKKPDYNRLALELHKKLKGKIAIAPKGKLKTKLDWSTMYSPGVGAVSSHLAKLAMGQRFWGWGTSVQFQHYQ